MSSRSELAQQLAAWLLTIFLQTALAAESTLFSYDYGNFNALQQLRLNQKDTDIDGDDGNDIKRVRSDRSDFSIDDYRILKDLWPPYFSVRRVVLTGISEVTGLVLSFFDVRHKQNTPFPSENISLVMLLFTLPYLGMMIQIVASSKSKRKAKARVLCLWAICGISLVFESSNAVFRWTLPLIESELFEKVKPVVTGVNAVAFLLYFTVELIKTMEAKQALTLRYMDRSSGDVLRERRLQIAHRALAVRVQEAYLYVTFPAFLSVWLLDSARFDDMSYAAFEITDFVAYVLQIYGHEILEKDVLLEELAIQRINRC